MSPSASRWFLIAPGSSAALSRTDSDKLHISLKVCCIFSRLINIIVFPRCLERAEVKLKRTFSPEIVAFKNNELYDNGIIINYDIHYEIKVHTKN